MSMKSVTEKKKCCRRLAFGEVAPVPAHAGTPALPTTTTGPCVGNLHHPVNTPHVPPLQYHPVPPTTPCLGTTMYLPPSQYHSVPPTTTPHHPSMQYKPVPSTTPCLLTTSNQYYPVPHPTTPHDPNMQYHPGQHATAPHPPPSQYHPIPPPATAPHPPPLPLSALVAASPHSQRRLLAHRLLPVVATWLPPQLAAAVTLELEQQADASELILMLECEGTRAAWVAKVLQEVVI